MTAYYRTESTQEKSEAYNEIRDTVLSRFPGALLKETKGIYSIGWNGIEISEQTTCEYEAWLDVALPF